MSHRPNTSQASDSQLVQRCLRGDNQAWRTLVERYARLVHSVPVRYGLPPVEVDDVGQEVFLILAQNLHQIEDPERIGSWLLTTTRRITWRTIQKRRREQIGDVGDLSDSEIQRDPTSQENETPVAQGRTAPTFQELISGWTHQQALNEGMSLLDERCRKLLYLLFLDTESPSYDEIGEALEMPVGSIGPTRNRCLAKLRTILEGLGHDDLL
jgi:RNA polymerase sigma factor (sigma-70 family)